MSQLTRRLILVAFLLLAALSSLNCGNEVTNPPILSCLDDTNVLLNDPAYVALTQKPEPVPGRLSKNCGANPRYCYYLEDAPVFTLGNQTILDNFVGDRVLIVGKIVFPTQGPGELWPGTICRFRQ